MSELSSQSATNPVSTPTTSPPTNYRIPSDATLRHVTKLAILEDKPVMMDYWTLSLDKKVIIGLRDNDGDKLLIKSSEEYTSPISKLFKVKDQNDLIIQTENSIYIVSADIDSKRII